VGGEAINFRETINFVTMAKTNKKKVEKKVVRRVIGKESIHQALARIQRELKAPKLQHNDFANFDYRSCEDILEAVKPLLNGCYITLKDLIVKTGERYYVKARATLSNGSEELYGEALARESEFKKGMDSAQVTGATSSYARKYALNGLLAIDDAREMDSKKGPGTPGGVKSVRGFFAKMEKEMTKDNIEEWEKKIQSGKGLTGNNRILLQRKLEELKKKL